jgi:hypothetical protein
MERQQIKWPAFTAVMAASGSVLTYTIAEAIGSPWLEWAGFVILIIGGVATTQAVFRTLTGQEERR